MMDEVHPEPEPNGRDYFICPGCRKMKPRRAAGPLALGSGALRVVCIDCQPIEDDETRELHERLATLTDFRSL